MTSPAPEPQARSTEVGHGAHPHGGDATDSRRTSDVVEHLAVPGHDTRALNASALDAASSSSAAMLDPRVRGRREQGRDSLGGTDEDLLRAHLSDAQDPQALAELFRRHRGNLWAVTYRALDHYQDAQDALQDTLTRAFLYAGTYRGDASVGTWLYRIALNVARDSRKRRRNSLEDLGQIDDQIEDPAGQLGHEQVNTDDKLEEALELIPAVLRDAFLLAAYLEFTVEETAVMLDLPVGTVKSRVWRARQYLQRIIGREEAEGNP